MNHLSKYVDNLEIKRQLCEAKIADLLAYIPKFSISQMDEALTCIGVCVNSNLFRGMYHPSPMRDLIAGGAKRGRFVSGEALPRNVSHRYFLNHKNQLVRVEGFCNQEISCIEYLFYEKNIRIGITADQKNRICGISEEVFTGEQIASFAYLSYFEIDQNHFLGHMEWEEFKYNENGIFSFDYVPSFSQGERLFAFSSYHIESQNGLINNYTSENGTVYPVKKKRESSGRGHYLGGQGDGVVSRMNPAP